jgi:tryptophan-rich sensory protein
MVTRDIRPGDSTSTQKKIPLLFLIILILTVYWLLSFFGTSIVPGVSHTAGFIDMLSGVIVVLIITKFLL